MTLQRDGMLFYRSYYEAIRSLPKKERLGVYEAIFAYSLNGEEAALTGVAATVFLLIKPTLDASRRKAMSGRKGGMAQASGKQTPGTPEGMKDKGCKTGDEGCKTGDESGKTQDKGCKTGEQASGIKAGEAPAAQDDDDLEGLPHKLRVAAQAWFDYKEEKNQPYKPTGRKSLLAELQSNAAQHGDAAVVSAIRKSMAANYHGIVWPREDAGNAQATRGGNSNVFRDLLEQEGET